MRNKKIVTPVLLYLVILLLILLVYYTFAFKPLQAKVDALRAENNMFKTQQLQVELALKNEEKIREEIESMKVLLDQAPDYTLVDGNNLTDDIYRNAKAVGVSLRDIVISAPELVRESGDGESLLKITADILLEAGYEEALEFIKGLEESKTGAYLIDTLDIIGGEVSPFDYKLSLSLYYYGSQNTVPDINDQQEGRNGVWTQ
mgnify:FL=1